MIHQAQHFSYIYFFLIRFQMHQMSLVRIIRLTSDASLGKKLNDFRFVSFLFEPLTW